MPTGELLTAANPGDILKLVLLHQYSSTATHNPLWAINRNA